MVFAFAGDSTITKDFLDKLDFAIINNRFNGGASPTLLTKHESVIGDFHNNI
jgi:hypothetical protein